MAKLMTPQGLPKLARFFIERYSGIVYGKDNDIAKLGFTMVDHDYLQLTTVIPS